MTVAAVVDRDAAVGDADVGQRVAVKAALLAVEAEHAEPFDPLHEVGEIGREPPLRHGLQREIARLGLAAPVRLASPRRRRGPGWRRPAGARDSACGGASGAGAMVVNGRSPPRITLIRPSGSIRIVGLASTRRKLSTRGLPIRRLVPEMPMSAFDATRNRCACRIAQHDVAKPELGAALGVALQHGAADLDAIAIAEVLLDRRGQPRGRKVERDGAAEQPPPQQPAGQENHRQRSHGRDGEAAEDRMLAAEQKPGIEVWQPMRKADGETAQAPAAPTGHGRPRRPEPAYADAHQAPPPFPGAPRCADCYPYVSCPIGRPLVRRFDPEPVTLGPPFSHACRPTDSRDSSSDFARNPRLPPRPLALMPATE